MDEKPDDLAARVAAAADDSKVLQAGTRQQMRHVRGTSVRLPERGKRVRQEIEMGGYRILVTEEPGRYLVEVHEARNGRWRLVAGPHIYPALPDAAARASDITALLSARRRQTEWSVDE